MKRLIVILFLVSAIIFLCTQCAQKAETEALSVNPSEIQAGYAVKSYTVELTANCAWKATLTPADASSWVSVPASGNGSQKLNIRVLKNQFNAERRVNVQFYSAGGAKASLDIVQAGDPGAGDKVEMTARLGSYNLRMQQSDEEEVNKWDVRKSRLKTSILENNMDVFGVQEVNTTMQTWLKSNINDTYSFFFFSPYAQSGTGDKAQGIIYKTKVFDLVESGFFWAGTNPDTMCKEDTGTSGNFNRGGCWAILSHKATGIKIFFMNNHGCLNSTPNAQFAHIYVDQEKLRNKEGLASFFVGDMNARPTYDAIATYKTYWQDSFETAASKTGPENTYNGFSSVTGKYRLDYIFWRGSQITVSSYCCNNTLYGGLYASDHFPVYADVKVIK